MAKFDPKKADLNKDGKLSDYENNVGRKGAAAMKMHKPNHNKKMPSKLKITKKPASKPGSYEKRGTVRPDGSIVGGFAGPKIVKKQSQKKQVEPKKSAMKMDKSPMYNYKKGYAMKMGSKEIDSPSAFNMKDMANIQASPMMNHIPGDPKKGHDPKKNGATMSTGEQGGFVQRSQGPVTGGVVNTLDEVIMTVPKNKKKPKPPKKRKKPFRRTDVGRALSDIGDAIGGIFEKKHKTKFGRRGIVRGGVKPRGAKRYQRKVRRR